MSLDLWWAMCGDGCNDSSVWRENSGGGGNQPIISFGHANWSDQDLATVRANRGEGSGQAVLEAYALLINVATWARILEQAQGAPHVRGDALGAFRACNNTFP